MSKPFLYDIESLPALEEKVICRWGQELRSSDDNWRLGDIGAQANLRFERVSNSLLRHSFKTYLGFTSQTKSQSHAANCYKHLVIFFEQNKFSGDFKEDLKKSLLKEISHRRRKSNEYILWYFKDWYLWCSDLGFPFCCDEFAESFGNLKIAGNIKGQAVMNLDKDHGPLTDDQLHTLVEALKNDKSRENIKIRTLAWLFVILGSNPRNLALLKWKDFEVFQSENGLKVYILRVPRIKKRQSRSRSEFKDRELDSRVGKILEDLQKDQKAKQEDFMFGDPAGNPMSPLLLTVLFSKYIQSLLFPNGFKVTPRRLRYTFATKLVMSGASKEKVAELLDHSDLQHVQVYFDLRHKIKDFLSEAESKKLGEVFRRFDGNILGKEKAKELPGDVHFSYVEDENKPVIGNCGSNSFCDLNPPFSCFVCPKFNAFEDSLEVYEKVLKFLVDWSKRRKDKWGENDRVHSLMHDVQLALGDLISRIKKGEING